MNLGEKPICNIANCDEQGRVFIMDDYVLREISEQHKNTILEILDKINKNNLNGIIDTTIYNNTKNLTLKHKKINYISYPNEWCASMLKDAALFHLKLSEALFHHDLFLKDAHPWNILFEGGNPILIDFTSITSPQSLIKENFLQSNTGKDYKNINSHISSIVKEIHQRMYVPYFIKPLEAYFILGEGGCIRKLIESTSINTSIATIRLRNCIPGIKNKISAFIKTISVIKFRANIKFALFKLKTKHDPASFFKVIHKQIDKIDVTPESSGYANYYKAKGEDYCFNNIKSWNKKQLSVYEAINSTEIRSVIDVACNTGWFAIMAAHLGKEVVAIDIDESCIETLYKVVKENNLNILPLVIDITNPTLDRPSIYSDGLVLINTNQRFRSDAVIALGIIHHLSLGQGLTLSEILDLLAPLSHKILVIEFVSTNDPLIQNEPEFFPAYFNSSAIAENYSLEKLISLCQQRGFKVQQAQSNPSTRTILVCSK